MAALLLNFYGFHVGVDPDERAVQSVQDRMAFLLLLQVENGLPQLNLELTVIKWSGPDN